MSNGETENETSRGAVEGSPFPTGVATAVLLVLTSLQAVASWKDGRLEIVVTGIGAFFLSCAVIALRRKPLERLALVGLFGLCTLANLVPHLREAPDPDLAADYVIRNAFAAVSLFGYAAVGVAVALSYRFRHLATRLTTVAVLITLGVGISEGYLASQMESMIRRTSPQQWAGTQGSSPMIGYPAAATPQVPAPAAPPPASRKTSAPPARGTPPSAGADASAASNLPPEQTALTPRQADIRYTQTFEANPRNYLDREDPETVQWKLRVHDTNSAAKLSFPDERDRDLVRVEVSKVADATPWDVQLDFRSVQVKKGQKYALLLTAGGEPGRTIQFTLQSARPPWRPLAAPGEIQLKGEKSEYTMALEAKDSEDFGRLTLNLGEKTGAVEIGHISIQDLKSDANALSVPKPAYYVEYRLNHEGCRGADPDAAMSERTRILVLGGPWAYGAGIREEDTLAAHLQSRLNEAPPRHDAYTVFNCGRPGAMAAHWVDRAPDLVGRYKPKVVIAIVTPAEEMTLARSGDGEGASRPAPPLFLTWESLRGHGQNLRQRPYPETVRAMRALSQTCARNNARLVVAVFRTRPLQGLWKFLVASLSSGLGRDAPFIDLGEGTSDWTQFTLSPTDFRPSEVAHKEAAAHLLPFLRDQGLLP